MVNHEKLRKKFPVKKGAGLQNRKMQIKKGIEAEYQRKRAEMGLAEREVRRGVRYYAVIIIAMAIVGGFVGSSIYKRGGIDIAGLDRKKAQNSVLNIAIALGRYRYHVGFYPSTSQGLERLAEKQVKERGWLGPYIKEIRKDPWGNDYVYECRPADPYPVLYSKGPDGKAGTVDDIIPAHEAFDAAFRDTSWTEGWVPWHLRDVILADSKVHKEMIERQVAAALGASHGDGGSICVNAGWNLLTSPAAAPIKVTLPFDWKAPGSGVPLDAESVVVRQSLIVPEEFSSKFVALRIAAAEGALSVFINGLQADVRDIGRGGYECAIADKVRYGAKNDIEIKIESAGRASAGVTGDVYLVAEDLDGRVVAGSTQVETLSANESRAEIKVSRKLARFDGTNTVIMSENKIFEVDKPRLWTLRNPRVNRGNMTGRYVIRRIERHSDAAVTINSEVCPIKGIALDMSFGILGRAYNDAYVGRVLSAYKECGVNAVLYTAQRVCGEFLDLCESMGLLAFSQSEVKRLGLGEHCFLKASGQPSPSLLSRLRAEYLPGSGVVGLYPHWTWPDGAMAKMQCVTDADAVEFFVNGEKCVAPRKVGRHLFEVDVGFEPGEIKAMAQKNGVYYGQSVLKTATAPQALRFDARNARLEDGGVAIVEVAFTDEHGRHVPNAAGNVEFAIEEGPGEFIACIGEIEQSRKRRAVCRAAGGIATVAVMRHKGAGVPLRISASAPGLRRGYAIIPR